MLLEFLGFYSDYGLWFNYPPDVQVFYLFLLHRGKKMGCHLLCGIIFCSGKTWKSLVAFTFCAIVFIPLQLSDDHLLFALNLVLMLDGEDKWLRNSQSRWEKMSLVLPLTFSIISLCNHFKIHRIFHYLIFFLSFRSCVFSFFCGIFIMMVNDSWSVWVNYLKRLSFPSSRLLMTVNPVLPSVPISFLSVAIFAKSSCSLII